MNKDSEGRVCTQHKIGDRFCGYPNCNHLATAYLRKGERISDEARDWIRICNPELFRDIESRETL
jgi:hypothetical protein